MPLYMQNTQIEPEKTAGEIMGLLRRFHAKEIHLSFDDGQNLSGLSFTIDTPGGPAHFRLPARPGPIFKILQKQRSYQFRQKNQQQDVEQSQRIVWRLLLRWVQAQLALVETSVVDFAEVFLPYLMLTPTQTAYETFLHKQLAAPKQPQEASR